MANNLGKAFEQKFKEDFLKLPNCSIDRIYDSMTGYYGISNICDFIGYIYPNIYYMELKSHKGNTFPLSNLTQYDKLLCKVGIKGVRVGVILWFIEKDKIVYVPLSEITKMKNEGKKSINIKYLDTQEYKIIEIPSIKKRTFMSSDYSILLNLQEGE